MLKKKRTVLEMSENELKTVIEVISPGQYFQKQSKLDLQEAAIYWILRNGLSLSHEFTLIEMDDGSYGVLMDKNGCSCCQRLVPLDPNRRSMQDVIKKKSMNGLLTEIDGSILVEQTSHIKSELNLSPHLQHDSKPTVIGMQPLPTCLSINDATTKIHEGIKINPEEKNTMQRKDGGLSQFCAELDIMV
ncbi:Cadherin-7 [Dirofilaria immitis]